MPFEDELAEALRRTGDGFTPEGLGLVDAGERRGRRMVARRRAAVAGGSALALALIGTAGAYANGLLWSSGAGGSNVASSPEPPAPQPPVPAPGRDRAGTGAVTADQLTGVLKQLLPQGELSDIEARGTDEGPMVTGAFDDGDGKGRIGFSLSRVDPTGQMADDMVKCPAKVTLEYESCSSKKLEDGSRLLLFKGYEYPDRRVDTKCWRATVVTPQGFLIDAQEWNSATEKDSPISRPTPPLSLAQLQALVTSPLWHPALNDLPAAPAESSGSASSRPYAGAKAVATLEELLRLDGIPVVSRDEDGSDLGYLVLDEGKGKSLVSLQIQPASPKEPNMWADLFTSAETLPSGTKVLTRQQAGEKGGAGVVWWSAEALLPNGTRVIVSAFNAESQRTAATRKEPVLTLARMKELATSPKVASEYGR
ncbi:hypothetical protein [Streptomyces sp. NBC_01264]|uniref:hypothetical protein n=1 Tax=Streptomyces sp. NBC_01264 TaxID=2903804 RepID=UPI00224DE692|nr:hypothetical protein [Streptomyces sp. NBC_01264]MCX4780140.1 hypothetical protein [Streptomyces sp. NBC_01264]